MRGDDNNGRDGDSHPDPLGLLLLLFGVIFLVIVTSWATSYVHPRFSIEIQGLEGLDPSRNSTTVSAPAVNLTIHVDNKHHLRRVCLEEMTVIAYYNEASDGYNETSVGWSTLPAFCVDRWSAVDLGVTLPKDGVFLSQTVREKMARDRQDGGIKLSVEIKPIDPPKDASRACFQSCEPRLGESPVTVSCGQFC
ncbi:unnamed protein product [Urochloa humidicola]